MAPSSLRIERLSVRLSGRAIIEGFDLDLEPGARALLSGPSGSGKSTLLMCILGFVTPAAGRIELDRLEMTSETAFDLRRRIAWVPQTPPAEANLHVEEWLARPFGYRANRGRAFPHGRAGELLRRLGLHDGAPGQPLTKLSGGEMQRVALVGALLLERPLLLLDEPTSALDDDARDRVRELLAELDGVTILAAAHQRDALGADAQFIDLNAHEPAPAGAAAP